MGLSSSQARLLSLTARMHDIEYNAQRVEAQKLQMANESRRVYEDYLNALDKTKIQQKIITTNGSVTFVDTNLYNLMFGMSDGYGSYSAGSGTRVNSGGIYIGDDTGSSSVNVPWQYGLFSTTTGKMLVPDHVMEVYENNIGNREGFASEMTGWYPDPGASGGGGHSSGGGGGNGYVPTSDAPDVHNEYNPNRKYDLNPDSNADYNIGRKSSKTQETISGSGTKKLHVYDGVIDKHYYYDITPGSTSVTAKILDNGRLHIKSDGATIRAAEGQNDNIILKGKNNAVYTGDGDDTVRVNTVMDSNSAYEINSSTFNSGGYNGNTIDTGSGNDYIENFGRNNINAGTGTDYVYDRQNFATSIDGEELQFVNGGMAQDGEYGWNMQGGYGDCQFLSALNSLLSQGTLNQYVSITTTSDGWSVKFLKSNITQSVKQSNLTGSSTLHGDKDAAIIEAAMRLLISSYGVNMSNSSSGNALGDTRNFYLISKILFGEDTSSSTPTAGADQFTTEQFTTMLNAYKNGQISNLVVATDKTHSNSQLGICAGHAYAVDADKSVAGEYVTLINPHDNNDRINLDWDDFLKYFGIICLFGDSFEYYLTNCENGNANQINYLSKCNIASGSDGIVITSDTPEDGQYQYWLNIFDGIESAGGCETIPDDMMYSNEYLTNMLNNGFAYLKMWDNKNEEWVDTSVATNTSLQEVSDEVELRKAEAKYEADMKRIDMKDRRYDTQLAALDNERNAVKQEMETLKTVAKDNVERTFRLFS